MSGDVTTVRTASGFVAGFMVAFLLVLGVLGAAPAQAYWTDSSTGNTTLTTGVVGAPSSLVCTDPVPGQTHLATWTAPASGPVSGYRLTLTSNPTPNWNTVGTGSGAGNPPATIVGGTTDVSATTLQARWGVQSPGLVSLGINYLGTFSVRTIGPGGWLSTPVQTSWNIYYAPLSLNAVPHCPAQ